VKQYWELMQAKLEEKSTRERLMIFAGAAFLLVGLLNLALFDPLKAKQKAISAQMEQEQTQLQALQTTIQALQQSQHADAHSPLRLRINELRAAVREQDDYLESLQEHLVEPNKVPDLLQQVLQSNNKLQLVELKTLPVSLMVEKPATVGTEKSARAESRVPTMYKHGVQITVRGSYLELLNYLTALEKMPSRIFWGEASLAVEKHPDAVLTLTVYTLSMDKTWLTV